MVAHLTDKQDEVGRSCVDEVAEIGTDQSLGWLVSRSNLCPVYRDSKNLWVLSVGVWEREDYPLTCAISLTLFSPGSWSRKL